MKTKQILGLGLGAALSLALVPAAFALGTDAGVDVDNTATVNYKVGGVDQPPEDSNQDTFKVDLGVLFTVAAVDPANNIVPPGATYADDTDVLLAYTLTNNTNGTLDFYLVPSLQASPAFTPTGVQIYLDVDDDGNFEPGAADGSPITWLDGITEGQVVRLFVVSSIPDNTTATNGETVGVILSAFAASDASGAFPANVYTESASDTAGAMDVALGDTTGDAAGDAARDAEHSATDTYEIEAAALTITKTSHIITDPISCTVAGDPSSCTGGADLFRIPGAVIQYCITVSNAGAAPADSVEITDDLSLAPVTYVSSSLWTNVSAAQCAGTAAFAAAGNTQNEDDNAADGDEADPAGGSFAADTVTVQLEPSVNGSGGVARAAFRVTID